MYYRDSLIHLAFTQGKAIVFVWIFNHYNIKIIIYKHWLTISLMTGTLLRTLFHCFIWCSPQPYKLGAIIFFFSEKSKILETFKSFCKAHKKWHSWIMYLLNIQNTKTILYLFYNTNHKGACMVFPQTLKLSTINVSLFFP